MSRAEIGWLQRPVGALVLVLGLATGKPLLERAADPEAPANVGLIDAWGAGFWVLIEFTLPMAMIVIGGYAVASSAPVGRLGTVGTRAVRLRGAPGGQRVQQSGAGPGRDPEVWVRGRGAAAHRDDLHVARHRRDADWLVRRFGDLGVLAGLDLNTVNMILLLLALLLHWRPRRMVRAVFQGAPAASGVLLQFPFYGGIFGMIAFTGLSDRIAGWLVVVYDLGEASANLLQPFWMLPTLAILGLEARDVMGYTFAMFLVCFPVAIVTVTLLAPHVG